MYTLTAGVIVTRETQEQKRRELGLID